MRHLDPLPVPSSAPFGRVTSAAWRSLSLAAILMAGAQGSTLGSTLASDLPGHAALSMARPNPAAQDGAGGGDDEKEPGRTVGDVLFVDLSFDDAMSRAERLDKILVVYWTGGNSVRNEAFEEQMLADKAVQEWLTDNAVAVHIDTELSKRDARRNNLSAELIPCVDMLDLARGGRIERLFGEADSTRFMAAVYGIGTAKRPKGQNATEPFSWLAWGNAQYRNVGDPTAADDAVNAYVWCLTQADVYRSGFRAKYLEFLLERIAYCKSRTQKAILALDREARTLSRMAQLGTANEQQIFELTRVHFWMRAETSTRDVFISLKGKGKAQEQARKWLFPTVVPVLGRYQQYGEIMDLVGDGATEMFGARIERLAASISPQSTANVDASAADGPVIRSEAEIDAATKKQQEESAEAASAGEKDPKKPLSQFTLRDTRSDLIEDASWVYEALLSSDKHDQAKELFTLISVNYPVNKTFGLFTERALRLEEWGAAAETADLGMALLDERGKRRMQRLLQRIPKDAAQSDDGK